MTREEAVQLVRSAISEQLCKDNFDLSATMLDLEGDSLDMVHISIIIEDSIDKLFPKDLSQFKTVNDIVKFVETCQKTQS